MYQVTRYNGCAAGWQPAGSGRLFDSLPDAERALALFERINGASWRYRIAQTVK